MARFLPWDFIRDESGNSTLPVRHREWGPPAVKGEEPAVVLGQRGSGCRESTRNKRVGIVRWGSLTDVQDASGFNSACHPAPLHLQHPTLLVRE
jgi:hypothetical protein